jgi:hypothetical protein
MEKQSAISSQQSTTLTNQEVAEYFHDKPVEMLTRYLDILAEEMQSELAARVGALHDAYHKLWTKHGDLAEPTVSEVEAAALAQAEVEE